jgi:ankyrin repeat protein
MKKLRELPPEEFVLPPLHQAARQRDVEAAKELLAQGHDPNLLDERKPDGDGGNPPLWYAAQGLPNQGVPVADILVQAGANINEQGEHGMSALHMACSWGHADMVKFLCESGASLDVRDKWGRTPKELALADYREAQSSSQDNQPEGWDVWFSGMTEIVAYFEANQPVP